MLCAMRGYQCIITTNKKCSQEKMDSIKAYGAQLVIGPEGVDADRSKPPQLLFDVESHPFTWSPWPRRVAMSTSGHVESHAPHPHRYLTPRPDAAAPSTT